MNRVDRLMGMLTVLQSKKYVTGDYLSDKFKISVRTVYRDIKALIEIGVPVSFETHRGYFIVQGYFLPPVTFSNDEANALTLMGMIADRFADESIKQHYDAALTKIKAVLRISDKEKVEYLRSQIRIHEKYDQPDDVRYLSEIQKAIVNKTILRIGYRNNESQKSTREVEPIGLTFYGLSWHLIAWCWKRTDYRDFRITSILDLVDTEVPFRKEKHLDINEYIKSLH
jgi:predicted DNA-binding transcriptional regulator YafY